MVYRLGWLLWTLVQRGSNQAPDFRDDLAGISRFICDCGWYNGTL